MVLLTKYLNHIYQLPVDQLISKIINEIYCHDLEGFEPWSAQTLSFVLPQ